MVNRHRITSLLARYLLPFISVGIATELTRAMKGKDPAISPLLFASVLLNAWYGGWGPGLLATGLSVAATEWLLTPQGWSIQAVAQHLPRLVVFTVVALLTSSLHSVIRQSAAETRRAREAAESASNAKSRFLAMVSHELRTPLSPVLMAADMLAADPRLPPEMLADVQTIRRQVDLEIRLIDDLVDLTRISSAKMELRRERIDLHEPLRQAIAVCMPAAMEKQLIVEQRLAPASARVDADPVRLQQIFWNLLRNAIKFTPAGGTVRIETTIAGSAVSVAICDTGIGIDPGQLSRIFTAFEQGDEDVAARFGGLGLGLAICDALVQAHQGTITAESPGRGLGATFTVCLPLAAQQAVS